MRLDAYMAQYWPEHSRSVWQHYIEQGYVIVNDIPVTSVRHELGEDDIVTHAPLPVLDFTDLTLPVIYEDEHVLVINKPTGVLTHAKGALTDEFSVAEFARLRLREPDESNRPGIVHRLDRATSGVMICAKDAITKKHLQKQFQDRKAHKTYLAIVDGAPKHSEAKIDLPIERNPKSPSSFRVGANGKSATTTYRVLAQNGAKSVLELKPLTGRTHQLRVHMAYLGCPIVGDVIYGGSTAERLMLHAAALEITIPEGDRRTFTAALPEPMHGIAQAIGYDDAL